MSRLITFGTLALATWVCAELVVDAYERFGGYEVLVEQSADQPIEVPPILVAGCDRDHICTRDDVVSKPVALPPPETLTGWDAAVHPEPAEIGSWTTKTIRAKPARKKSAAPKVAEPWQWLDALVHGQMTGRNVHVISYNPWSTP